MPRKHAVVALFSSRQLFSATAAQSSWSLEPPVVRRLRQPPSRILGTAGGALAASLATSRRDNRMVQQGNFPKRHALAKTNAKTKSSSSQDPQQQEFFARHVWVPQSLIFIHSTPETQILIQCCPNIAQTWPIQWFLKRGTKSQTATSRVHPEIGQSVAEASHAGHASARALSRLCWLGG